MTYFSAGFSFDFLFNHPVFDFLKFPAREKEGRHPVKEDANPPANQRPYKPEMSRSGEEVNDD
jgi:hypothetical protein